MKRRYPSHAPCCVVTLGYTLCLPRSAVLRTARLRRLRHVSTRAAYGGELGASEVARRCAMPCPF